MSAKSYHFGAKSHHLGETWQRIGAIATGGSVLSIRAGAMGQTWLATGGGILSDAAGGWRPLPEPVPLDQAGLVGAVGSDWWVAGLSGGLILTWDGGRSWASAWIDQVSEPITCFAASPRYESDITLLAGTAGAGVLRSTDGGRRWQLSNFGLEEYTILALATAGDWSRRQVVFAGAADGVYRSSGGGRAWKSVGLRGLTVQSLAAGPVPGLSLETSPGPPEVPSLRGGSGLPDASGAWTILAGTEANGLYRAQDGGFTWERCGHEIGDEVGINALLCSAERTLDGGARSPITSGRSPITSGESHHFGEVWLAGTDEGNIWRSADNGETWSLVCGVEGPVLAFAESHHFGAESHHFGAESHHFGADLRRGRLLAGTSEHGLWVSTDLGLNWRPDDTLCAWGFRRLYSVEDPAKSHHFGAKSHHFGGGQRLAALAPTGGVWLSAAAQGWERALEASLYEPVLAYSTAGDAWLAARADGLWRGAPGAEPERVLESGGTPIVALASPLSAGTVWAGAADGALWTSGDEGASWQALDVPFRDQRLLGLAFSPDGTPLVGTFAEQRKEATLWRHADGRWQRWLSRSDSWAGLALAAAGAHGEESWAALGGKPYAHTATGWQPVEIAGHEGGIAAITGITSTGSRYLICASEVLCQDPIGEWRTLPLPEEAAAPVDLCILSRDPGARSDARDPGPSGALLCLDAAGTVWRSKIPRFSGLDS